MMRPVTRAFPANDMEKSDTTNERYNSNAACDGNISMMGDMLGYFARVVTEIPRDTFSF